MARRNQPEQELQKTVAGFLDVSLPANTVWYHIPNGGKRTRAEAGLFKAMGVKAGVPDIHILHEGRSIYIELKVGAGKETAEQIMMRHRLVSAGAVCTVCRSLEEVADFLGATVGLKAKVTA